MRDVFQETKVEKSERKIKYNRFDKYFETQKNQDMVWYIIPLMSIPAVFMPISIFAMSYFNGYLFFIGLSILLFFTNIILTIAEVSTKIKIIFYLFTVLVLMVTPVIIFVIHQLI